MRYTLPAPCSPEKSLTTFSLPLMTTSLGSRLKRSASQSTGPCEPPAHQARLPDRLVSEKATRRYLIPTTIESGPARCSTYVSRKPTFCIHEEQSAPV